MTLLLKRKEIEFMNYFLYDLNSQLNQLNQMKATILRSMNEMRAIGAASRSGM